MMSNYQIRIKTGEGSLAKISTSKYLRNIEGVDLLEAKDYVDRILDGEVILLPTPRSEDTAEQHKKVLNEYGVECEILKA